MIVGDRVRITAAIRELEHATGTVIDVRPMDRMPELLCVTLDRPIHVPNVSYNDGEQWEIDVFADEIEAL